MWNFCCRGKSCHPRAELPGPLVRLSRCRLPVPDGPIVAEALHAQTACMQGIRRNVTPLVLRMVPSGERTDLPTFLQVPVDFLVYLIRRDCVVHLWQFGLSRRPAPVRTIGRRAVPDWGRGRTDAPDLPIVEVQSIRTTSTGWEDHGSQRPVKRRREPDRGKSAGTKPIESSH